MLATQLTDATYHMFSTREFARMKPTAFIINMARGPRDRRGGAADRAGGAGRSPAPGSTCSARSRCLRTRRCGMQPNVLITPHATPSLPDKTQRSIDMIVANIERYRAGRPMINVITEQDIFTPRDAGA